MNDDTFFVNDIFALSPMAKRAYLEPGTTYDATIRITNPAIAKNTLHFKIEAVPYNVVNENYDADFRSETEYTKISNWITLDQDEGYVEPNNSTTITYHINVPADAPGGGQYCALSVRSLANEESTNSGENVTAVSDIIELSSIIYAQVNGDVKREGEILENKIPIISFKNPITTTMSFRNTGNVHQDATVAIKATNIITGQPIMLDGSDAENYDEEDTTSQGVANFNEIVMPDSSRFVTRQVQGLPDLGIYKISQTVKFSGTENTVEHIIFMTPVWFLCLVIAVIASTIALIVYRNKKRRKTKPQTA